MYNYRSSKIFFSIVIITILADIQNHGWSVLINALDMPCKNPKKVNGMTDQALLFEFI